MMKFLKLTPLTFMVLNVATWCMAIKFIHQPLTNQEDLSTYQSSGAPDMWKGNNTLGNQTPLLASHILYTYPRERRGFNTGINPLILKRLNRRRELSRLYGEIAKEFPFLVKQGLLAPHEDLTLDHLLTMTIFGQPKAGKR